MKKLLKTTVDGVSLGRRHSHIAYINDEDQVGATSVNNKHTHQLIYDPPRPPRPPSPAIPPQMDPMTGMPMMVQDPTTGMMMPDPGTPEDPGDPGKEEGTWIVAPAEDGHTHELAEYVVKEKKSKESDEDIIKDCMALWQQSINLTCDSRKKAREAEDFRRGKQWPENIRRQLEALDRAALTINLIGKNLDELFGYQRDERTDLIFSPQEEGDQRVADILNIVTKVILSNCFYPREESKAFEDMVVPGMGVLSLYIDFNNDIRGEIKIERFPWDDIYYGEFTKEDLSDCEYEIRSKMYSKAKIKQLWPKKANEVESNFNDIVNLSQNPKTPVGGGTYTDYNLAKVIETPITPDGLSIPMVDVAKKEFRVVQCTRKVYEPVSVIFSDEEDFFFTAFGWDEKDIASATTIPGFSAISQIKTRMRITKFCGKTILSDENPADLPIQDFFTIPCFAYRQNNDFWGKVESAKDPQKEINKRRSHTVDIINRTTRSIWWYDTETFADPHEEKRFKEKASQPGATFKLQNRNNKPIAEEGGDLPTGLVQMLQLDQAYLSELMNISVEPGGANESGVLFQERKRDKLRGNQFLFDNFSFAKQRLGKILVHLIQRYYDADRIIRILNSQYSKQQFDVGGQDYSQYSKEEIKQMLENQDLTKYDVVVSETSFSPSTRLGTAKVIFELMKNGAPVPPELVFEFLDMPDVMRKRISESLQQQMEMQTQTQNDTANSEITKTVVAKGDYTITPEKAQELGLVPTNQNSVFLNNENQPNNEIIQGDDEAYASNLVDSLAG